jgi:disulfide bond formation protein DsbB
MFCCRTSPDRKIESMASILILGGVLPLAVALMAQYGFGLAPCHFCLLQRYPYVAVIACGALSLLVPRGSLCWRFLVALGILALLVTGTLGGVHTGIERGWLNYKGGCVAEPLVDHSAVAILASIKAAPLVPCNEVAASFLHLSMATWNVLWAGFVIVLIGLQYRFDRRRFIVGRWDAGAGGVHV